MYGRGMSGSTHRRGRYRLQAALSWQAAYRSSTSYSAVFQTTCVTVTIEDIPLVMDVSRVRVLIGTALTFTLMATVSVKTGACFYEY